MAEKIENKFTSYFLTEDEEIQGSIFSPLQRMVIQNEISQAAEIMLELDYHPDKSQEFVQQQAFHRGIISRLSYMLERSDSILEAQAEIAQAENPNN